MPETNTQNNPYYNVPFLPLENSEQTTKHGAQFFSNVKQLQVGFGASVFRVDRDGMWAGAETYADAPWKVDWDGNMVANSLSLSGYIPTGGALNDIGSGNITGTYIANGAIVTDKLATNAVVASKIDAGAVTASKISVSTLSAITADVGTLTAGTISGVVISSQNSGTRTVISGSLTLYYNSSGTEVASVFANSSTLLIDGSQTSSNIVLDAGSSGLVLFRVGSTSIVSVDDFGMLPFTDNSYDLGHPSFRWSTFYAVDGFFDGDLEVADDLFIGNDCFIVNGDFEISGNGFFNLSNMTGTTADGLSSQNGSMYYRTSSHDVRIKINGTWRSVNVT